MPQDDPLNIREADSRSFELLSAMKALKHTEETVGIGHIEAHTVVAHEYHHLVRLLFGHADFDLGTRLRS
jgi:hypothetical protein